MILTLMVPEHWTARKPRASGDDPPLLDRLQFSLE